MKGFALGVSFLAIAIGIYALMLGTLGPIPAMAIAGLAALVWVTA